MKHARSILLLPMDGMQVHRYTQQYVGGYPFIHLSEERQSGVKFPFRGNNTTGKASTVTSRSRVRGLTRSATHASTVSIAFITGCVKTKSLLIIYLFISKACSSAKFKTFSF